MKRVLVTGSTGWIGSYCVPLLKERGFEVLRLKYIPAFPKHDHDSFQSEVPEEIFHQADYCLYLGWITDHGEYWQAPKNIECIAQCINFIRIFHRRKGQRIVVAGTQAERGDSLYGISKDSLRRLLAAYCRETGLSYGWGRIYNVYGKGEDEQRLIPAIKRQIENRHIQRWIKKQKFTSKHDYLHVSEVARRLVELLDSDTQGIVEIKSGVERTIPELIEWVKSDDFKKS